MGRRPYDGSMERHRRGRPRHPDVLTPAEWRVLDALREGGTNAEIAARLGLSADTVKTHISNMLAKLELRDRRALAAWRPDTPRRRLGGVLAVPAVVWSVGRPLAWVGVGAAALAGVVVVVVVLVALEGIVERGSDAPAVIERIADDDGDPGSGSTVVETELEVLSCESGVAVTNPTTNTELVADCESLLGLRDTIRGTGRLNWTAGNAMLEWMGVKVSGTPQRVTGLDLADFGLDGELSGLLGNLTGLTTLDLSGNPLTGMLPSKLALLTSLTTVSLAGTSFVGCAPARLGAAATNDLARIGLTDCGEPSLLYADDLPAGTYMIPGSDREPRVVFDLPPEHGLLISGLIYAAPPPPGTPGPAWSRAIGLMNVEETCWLGIVIPTGVEAQRGFDDDFTSVGTVSGYTQSEYEEIFDRIIDSVWTGDD